VLLLLLMNKVKVIYKGNSFSINAESSSFFRKFSGLMFRPASTSSLLFAFAKPKKVSLHSIFVFFDFLILWIGEKNKVVDFRLARPFKMLLSSDKKCLKILEIPLNSRNKRIIRFFVGNKKI